MVCYDYNCYYLTFVMIICLTFSATSWLVILDLQEVKSNANNCHILLFFIFSSLSKKHLMLLVNTNVVFSLNFKLYSVNLQIQ